MITNALGLGKNCSDCDEIKNTAKENKKIRRPFENGCFVLQECTRDRGRV